MTRYFYIYFVLSFFSSCQIAWGGKIPYDPDLGNQLATSYSIVTVPQIKKSVEERKETKENKRIKLSLNLKHPELYNQGDDGACAFFSTVCSMLMVESGKEHLKKMFLGQDDDCVYIKFPAPQPFGITDADEFLTNFKGTWKFGFDKVQFLKKSVFKVSKEIIEDHAPLSEFPNAPGWFRLLAAAYSKVAEFVDSDFTGSEDSDEEIATFSYLPTSFPVSYFQNKIESTEIDILSGKPLLFNLNIKEAYEKKEFPSISLLIDKPIRNLDYFHARAMHISENYVYFFDSLGAEKKVFLSNLFNKEINTKDLEAAFIDNIALLEEKKSLLEQVKKEHETSATTTEEEKHRERLAEAYELSCSKFAASLEQRFPLHESCKPLNIMELSTQDFIVRLYAELLKYNFFKLEVLDL